MRFLRCIGKAIVARGLRGLMGLVPFGEQLYDVSADAIEWYRRDKHEDRIGIDLEEVVQADGQTIRAEAKQIAQEVAAGHPPEEIAQLEAYLSQVPGIARQSLRRQDDPSGTTVPSTLDLRDPVQLASVLPRKVPRFRGGDFVPHAPQWKLVEPLGCGGFGEVWLARHTFLDQCRAVKFCLDPSARDRLLRHEGEVVKRVMAESQGMKADEHGIVPLVDAYLEGDTPWLAYEFVDGGDLSGLVRRLQQVAPPQRAAEVLPLLAAIARVVGRFHRLPQPIIHRDLKPANILLKNIGGQWLLRVTDFGISHITADRNIRQATVSTPSLRLGKTFRGSHTPLYASPQQKRGLKADVRDDIFALGIIGYQLLLADLSAERPGGKWRKRLTECGLSDATLDVLESCWDDDPSERPQDAMAMAESLNPSPKVSVSTTPPLATIVPDPTPVPIIPMAEPVSEYTHWLKLTEDLKEQAQRAFENFEFNRAVSILLNVPAKLRDNGLLADWTSKRDQLEKHWHAVESGWREMSVDELIEHLEAILAIQPDHPRAKPWLEKAHSSKQQQKNSQLRGGKIGQVIEVPLTNSLKMSFAWVPPGKSWLGGGGGAPGTQEFKLLQGLWCGVYPVTQAEWQAIAGNNPSLFSNKPRNPVEQVSWNHVQEFFQKLNVLLSDSGLSYRLPTEQEWEYICRGGPLSSPTQSAYYYYFAKSRTDLTPVPTNNLSFNQAKSEVGLFLPNPLGIYDLQGNVWEWTASSEGSNRVIRGGSWSAGVSCAASYRSSVEPSGVLHYLGFRLLAVPVG